MWYICRHKLPLNLSSKSFVKILLLLCCLLSWFAVSAVLMVVGYSQLTANLSLSLQVIDYLPAMTPAEHNNWKFLYNGFRRIVPRRSVASLSWVGVSSRQPFLGCGYIFRGGMYSPRHRRFIGCFRTFKQNPSPVTLGQWLLIGYSQVP